MSRLALFFISLCVLWIAACSSRLKNNVNNTEQLTSSDQPVLLQFSKNEPVTIYYEEDNPMEVVLWNNPIKPSKEVDLLTTLPEKIKIPENMVFVAGRAFEASNQRIRGFFMDTHPVDLTDFNHFLEKSEYTFVPASFSESGAKIASDTILHLSWEKANAYCKWLGKRLPTQAEWTYAFSDKAPVQPYGTRLVTNGKWEWLIDWYLPKGQDPHIFVPDAESKKMVVRKTQAKRPIYEWKPMEKKSKESTFTCRCVEDVLVNN